MTAQQSATKGDRVVRISYHKRMYGLGEVSIEPFSRTTLWVTG